jgi:hypothetical protein
VTRKAEAQMENLDVLDAIQARADKATEGPWSWENCGEKCNDIVIGLSFYSGTDTPISGEIPGDTWDGDKYVETVARKSALLSEVATIYDAAFIAAAREDVPRLVRALRAALAGLPCSLSIEEDPCPCHGCMTRAEALAELGEK